MTHISDERRAGIHWSCPRPAIIHEYPEADVVTASVTSYFAVQMADAMDKAVVDAIIAEAVKAGCTEGFVIDRQFVLAAIMEKIEREKDAGDRGPGKAVPT